MRWLRYWSARLSSTVDRSIRSLGRLLSFRWLAGVGKTFGQIGRMFAYLFHTLVDWCSTLDLRLLAQGLPALVVGATCLAALGFAGFTQTQDIENRYKKEAETASKAKDYPQALACYE